MRYTPMFATLKWSWPEAFDSDLVDCEGKPTYLGAPTGKLRRASILGTDNATQIALLWTNGTNGCDVYTPYQWESEDDTAVRDDRGIFRHDSILPVLLNLRLNFSRGRSAGEAFDDTVRRFELSELADGELGPVLGEYTRVHSPHIDWDRPDRRLSPSATWDIGYGGQRGELARMAAGQMRRDLRPAIAARLRAGESREQVEARYGEMPDVWFFRLAAEAKS